MKSALTEKKDMLRWTYGSGGGGGLVKSVGPPAVDPYSLVAAACKPYNLGRPIYTRACTPTHVSAGSNTQSN